jgi:hypothetical protein
MLMENNKKEMDFHMWQHIFAIPAQKEAEAGV